MPDAHLRVFRGSPGEEGHFDEFDVPVEEGMVVLDALHWIQGHEAPDLAVRWNCKAAKCGSCSAEVDGRPSLTCKTRLSDFDLEEPITVEPMRAFPLIRDLVTDVSWNYEVNKTIQPFTPPEDVPQEDWRWQQQDIERVQEYRKCIECFLCQDVCHVLRNHETAKPFMGPRFLVRTAGLEMHPIDQADRREYLKDSGGIGYCNITKCCTEVCPEHIKITDNAIIPLKERVADKYYDPIQWVWRKVRGGGSGSGARPASSCRCSRGRRRRLPIGPTSPRRPIERHALPGPRARADGRLPPPKPPPAASSSGPTAPPAATRGRRRWGRRCSTWPGRTRATTGPSRTRRSPTTSASRPTTSPSTPASSGRSRSRSELGAREVHLLLDSKLIVEQLAGRWRVKDAKLIPLWSAARATLGGLRALDGDARAAGPELGRRRARERGDRPGAGRRSGVGHEAAGRLSRNPRCRSVVSGACRRRVAPPRSARRGPRRRRRGLRRSSRLAQPDPVRVARDPGRDRLVGRRRRRSAGRGGVPADRDIRGRRPSRARPAATSTAATYQYTAGTIKIAELDVDRHRLRPGDRCDGAAVHAPR